MNTRSLAPALVLALSGLMMNLAAAQQPAPRRAGAVASRAVTVTLVRWPFT